MLLLNYIVYGHRIRIQCGHKITIQDKLMTWEVWNNGIRLLPLCFFSLCFNVSCFLIGLSLFYKKKEKKEKMVKTLSNKYISLTKWDCANTILGEYRTEVLATQTERSEACTERRQTPKTFTVRSHATVLKNRFFYAENGHDKKEQDFDRAATRCFQRKRKACSDYRKHEGIFDANYDDDDAKLCLYVKTLVKPPAGDTPNWNDFSIVIIFYHVFLIYMPSFFYLGQT